MRRLDQNISGRRSYKNIVRGVVAILLMLCVDASVFAAVPEWVKQAGRYVEIEDSIDRGDDDVEKIDIKGYLLNYDFKSNCRNLYYFLVMEEEFPYEYDEKKEFRDINGVASLIFQEDGKVFVRGLTFYSEMIVDSTYNNVDKIYKRYWVEGQYDPSAEKIELPKNSLMAEYYEVDDFYNCIRYGKCRLQSLLLCKDGTIKEDETSDKIVFSCTSDGKMNYISDERSDGAVAGYGLRYDVGIVHQEEMVQEDGGGYCIQYDNRIELRNPQFYPGSLEWQEVSCQPPLDTPVYLAKDGDILYLNFCNQLIRGQISEGKVTFKGSQVSSINLPNPSFGVDLPMPLIEVAQKFKRVIKRQLTEYHTETDITDEDIIFDYDKSAQTLSSTGSFGFTRPYRMGNASRGLSSAPSVAKYFESLVLSDVPELYSGVQGFEAADSGESAYIRGGRVICDRPTDIAVYSVDGYCVTTFFGSEYDFTELPSGIYIIKAGNRTFKVRR